jgi:small-conductance mechanosensitive channel
MELKDKFLRSLQAANKTVIIFSLCLVLFIMATHSSFALSLSQAPVSQQEEVARAPVLIDALFLFQVRGIEAYPAKERARAIANRIKKVAANPQIKIDDIIVIESDLFSEIMAGKERIMALADADASLELVDRDVLAHTYASKIKEAIKSYRINRKSDRIQRGAAYAVLLTAALIGMLFLLKFLYKKLSSFLESRYKKKIQSLQIQSLKFVRADRIWKTLISLVRTIRTLLILLILYFYLSLSLNFFPWTRLLGQRLTEYIFFPLQQTGQAILDYLPNFIFIAIYIIITRYVLKLVRLFFTGIETKAISFYGFDSEWARPTYKLVRLFIFITAAAILYPYLPGAESSAFRGISILVGALVSLGSTSAISNTIAGYTLVYRRTFKIGDRVRIGDFTGDVMEMRLLATHLRSIKNEQIVVPNSQILNTTVVNYSSISKEDGLILHTNVTLGYDTPWRQVEALLLKAAGKTKGVMKEPKPFVLQESLDDFYVNYELNAYTNTPQVMFQTYSDLHQNILDAFNEADVQIMSPHYENDPGDAKVVPREKWYTTPAKVPEDSDASK